MTGPRITGTELTATQVSEVLALVEAARLADGVAPLSEHGILHLRAQRSGERPLGDDSAGRRRPAHRSAGSAVSGASSSTPSRSSGEPFTGTNR